MALRVVTDSTADLSPALRQEHGIEMVPLTVNFGDESFKQEVEMDGDSFWAKLQSSPHHPKTAQPAPGDFLALYQKLADQGDEILSIHLSAALSGTLNSAQIAAQMLPEARITTVDTRTVSMALGLLVIEASRMAQAGKPVAEIAAWVKSTAVNTHVYFTLDTLDFLQKNGRVGKAQAFLGGLLGIKPILHVDQEGVVAPLDKVRGRSKVLPRILELMKEKVPYGSTIRVGVLHAQAPDEAMRWLSEIKKCYQVQEENVAPIGPVIATNTGPGALGIAFFAV